MKTQKAGDRDVTYLAVIGIILTACGVSRLSQLLPFDTFWAGFSVTVIGIAFTVISLVMYIEKQDQSVAKRSRYPGDDSSGYKTDLQKMREGRGYYHY